MNIFVTNPDPIISARELCDRHCRSKMIVEGAQMLAHAFTQDVLNHPSTPRSKTGGPRRSGRGYYNHPCSVWARMTHENFNWLVEHTMEQLRERAFRWPDADEHFTKSFIEWCEENKHNTTITKSGLTPFAVAINSNCDCRQKVKDFDALSTCEKYRAYIKYDKPFASWTRRPVPEWY